MFLLLDLRRLLPAVMLRDIGFSLGFIDDAVTVEVQFGKLFFQSSFAEGDLPVFCGSDLAVLVQVAPGEHFFVKARLHFAGFRQGDRAIPIQVEAVEQSWDASLVDLIEREFAVPVGVSFGEQVPIRFSAGAGDEHHEGCSRDEMPEFWMNHGMGMVWRFSE